MSIFEKGMSEEQYKQAFYREFFKDYLYQPNFGKSKIDFVIADPKDKTRHLLWAEAKNKPTQPRLSLTQLILTAKKTYFGGEVVPPAYLATFDSEEINIYRTSDFV